MQELANLQKDLADLLSKYIDPEKARTNEYNWVLEHDFFNILENCEDLINNNNKEEEAE
jgi:sugar-specific transcriptional regulator TrmB